MHLFQLLSTDGVNNSRKDDANIYSTGCDDFEIYNRLYDDTLFLGGGAINIVLLSRHHDLTAYLVCLWTSCAYQATSLSSKTPRPRSHRSDHFDPQISLKMCRNIQYACPVPPRVPIAETAGLSQIPYAGIPSVCVVTRTTVTPTATSQKRQNRVDNRARLYYTRVFYFILLISFSIFVHSSLSPSNS